MIKYLYADRIIKKYLVLYYKYNKYNSKIIKRLIKFKLNYIGNIVGLEIPPGVLGDNATIYHRNVVINGFSKIGNNVKFHGNNCIGNNGINMKAPKIGNNVDIGFGAVIIGDVVIADDCIIGANSIVTHSFLEKGTIIVGNPATVINKIK